VAVAPARLRLERGEFVDHLLAALAANPTGLLAAGSPHVRHSHVDGEGPYRDAATPVSWPAAHRYTACLCSSDLTASGRASIRLFLLERCRRVRGVWCSIGTNAEKPKRGLSPHPGGKRPYQAKRTTARSTASSSHPGSATRCAPTRTGSSPRSGGPAKNATSGPDEAAAAGEPALLLCATVLADAQPCLLPLVDGQDCPHREPDPAPAALGDLISELRREVSEARQVASALAAGLRYIRGDQGVEVVLRREQPWWLVPGEPE
jgi:hypothetical protein